MKIIFPLLLVTTGMQYLVQGHGLPQINPCTDLCTYDLVNPLSDITTQLSTNELTNCKQTINPVFKGNFIIKPNL